jgi:hypothetical protein
MRDVIAPEIRESLASSRPSHWCESVCVHVNVCLCDF